METDIGNIKFENVKIGRTQNERQTLSDSTILFVGDTNGLQQYLCIENCNKSV